MSADAAELFEGQNRVAIRLAADEDADWLMVELEARAGPRVWKDLDPCLRRTEVERMITWFENVGPDPELRFRESDLAFELRGDQLVVLLDLEFAPPDWEEDAPFEIAVQKNPAQMTRFAVGLKGQLEQIDRGEVAERSPLDIRGAR